MNLPLPVHLAPLREEAGPVTFEQDHSPIAGWYHPPAAGARVRDCLVVLCNPLGYEAICTHRHYRVLAQQLAANGFAVLRYDHHGTGDSAGGDEDAQRLQAWIAGVQCALRFGRRRSGASRACLFGVRMGGTLALAAASTLGAVDAVVAWSPFASGAAYLRELRALQFLRDADASAPAVVHDSGADLGEEAAGYMLTSSTIAALGALKLAAIPATPAPALLLLVRDDVPDGDRLAQHYMRLGCAVTQRQVPGYADMMRDTFDSVVPQAAFAEIGAWLEARYAPLPAPPFRSRPPLRIDAAAGARAVGAGVTETAVQFGPDQRLFGIVSAPARACGRRSRTGVIFVNVGSNHHVGPNRMYVAQARALAALGFVALRMDIGGVGESPAAPGRRENHLYAQHSVADVQAAMHYLRQRRAVERVVLVGVCSGAYLSFHAAAGTAAVVLVNPQTFWWREGDSLQLRSRRSIRALRFYRSRVFESATWRRLLGGQISTGTILAGLLATQRRRLGLRLRGWLRRGAPAGQAAAPDVARSFRALLRGGTNVLLVYSGDDGGLNEMEAQLGANAAALRRHANFRLEIVDGADHTFTPQWAQRHLLGLLTQHIVRLYG